MFAIIIVVLLLFVAMILLFPSHGMDTPVGRLRANMNELGQLLKGTTRSAADGGDEKNIEFELVKANMVDITRRLDALEEETIDQDILDEEVNNLKIDIEELDNKIKSNEIRDKRIIELMGEIRENLKKL